MENKKQSKFGIASIVFALLTLLLIGYAAFNAMLFIAQHPDLENLLKENTRIQNTVLHWANTLIYSPIVGMGIGILGLCEENRKKLLAIIGLITNTCFLLISPIWFFF